MTTLQKLGEDVEGCLRQLLFGTVNKLLRSLIIEEMRKYGFLRPYELAILDRLSLIEVSGNNMLFTFEHKPQ